MVTQGEATPGECPQKYPLVEWEQEQGKEQLISILAGKPTLITQAGDKQKTRRMEYKSFPAHGKLK